MHEKIITRLSDLKARQQNGEHMKCPRCGADTMKEPVHTNALSREADLYVCDDCGVNEAMLAFMNNPLPPAKWACFAPERPPSDLEAMELKSAISQLDKVQIPYLCGLFKRWLDDKTGADFEAYRHDAYESCPGLQTLWPDPFRAVFASKKHLIHIRFKRVGERIEFAIDPIAKR